MAGAGRAGSSRLGPLLSKQGRFSHILANSGYSPSAVLLNEATSSVTQQTKITKQVRPPPRAGFGASALHRRAAGTSSTTTSSGGQQRYGTANEPPPHITGPRKSKLSQEENGPAVEKKQRQRSKKGTVDDEAPSESQSSTKQGGGSSETSSSGDIQDTASASTVPEAGDVAGPAVASAAPVIGALYQQAQQRYQEEQRQFSRPPGEDKKSSSTATTPLVQQPLPTASAQSLSASTAGPEATDSDRSSSSDATEDGKEAADTNKHPSPLSLATAPSPVPTNNDSSNTALSTILRMEQPAVISGDGKTSSSSSSSSDSSEQQGGETRGQPPPHLQAPRYTHHFDTYGLVREVQAGGFTEGQATSMMKVIRGLLRENFWVAREGLVSKGDAEMENYVFHAACSELRTEMRNNRATASTHARSERMQLQHEFDIASARLGSETSTLRDELKGMFDDRRMAVRTDRRDVENKLQELNYAITARLGSEMRQEVEGLRWVLVRRIAIAITAVAAMTLAALRLAKYEDEREKKRERSASSSSAVPPVVDMFSLSTASSAGSGSSPGSAGGSGSSEAATTENAELVSLG